ncbi:MULTISPECIES: 4'-phosphopantetheinyl transferase superfamily protein [unclassified Micromonospora]|uniref:4'-phosphopantetheinyl transferase family protein n=1 Tax=unclassified Micromonospora TaxID=2617518 RepID=UPI001C23638F|nr:MULTISPECIES: 4'-phosphopantetheinyl transferase superfamily protein [unclassified Micromonospora]MBU8861415.1 4'-phosphopantetheinyl transferase superfamily protein [Micromonospora sp. WMMB482]MDM4780975.1 4'-phosphopantetheinyl transferase superfamily protein [Micromonospora sp. b486]
MRDAVRVWIVPVAVPADELARYRAVLDADERDRAARFDTEALRDRFTVAHGALRVLAGRATGASPAALAWRRGRYGKPVLTGPWSGLHTSLSYSGDLVAVALSEGRPVGVDVQHVAPGGDPVSASARFFHPQEARHVAAGPGAAGRALRFTRLWARKEAAVKAAGGRLWPNLGMPVHRGDVVECVDPAGPHRLTDLRKPAGYAVAVALAGERPYAVECRTGPGQDR